VDGVGLGEPDAARNAFAAAPPRTITALLDGAALVRRAAPVRARNATLVALDATLGVAGTPMSGTGQTALLTGINAPAEYGRHFGPWVPSTLRPVLRSESLLARAQAAGFSVAFANAYPEEVVRHVHGLNGDDVPEGERRGTGVVATASPDSLPSDGGGTRNRRATRFLSAGPPLVALGAGVLNRHTRELERGDAIASEITNDGWRERLGRRSVPVITARRAGQNLARIAAQHDVTLFAHYTTDYAGHSKRLDHAVAAIQTVDEFIAGIAAAIDDQTLVVVTSDHGNIEDITTDHTLNPAIGLILGARHAEIAGEWTSVLDVTPGLLAVLG
jgi:hypothetical protein